MSLKRSLKQIYLYHESSLKLTNQFDFLDGFRGFLALTVIFQHFQGYFDAKGDYQIFRNLGIYFYFLSFNFYFTLIII
jgi:hypothetical protein